MKILGLMGSPRKQGNTDLLLDQAFSGARSAGAQVEKVMVPDLEIAPCREYYGCLRDGNCVIEDDMTALYPKLWEADAVILASPIFFYGLTAQAKALVDRCQALWARRHVLKHEPRPGRKGVLLAVGATRGRRLFEGTVLTARYFFDAIGVECTAGLLIRGADKKGEIRDHPTALKDALELGRRLALGEELPPMLAR